MLSASIDNLIKDLKPRQRDVLISRFGLDDGKKKTLASIGGKYNLTRERVRQIEEEALRTVQKSYRRKRKINQRN